MGWSHLSSPDGNMLTRIRDKAQGPEKSRRWSRDSFLNLGPPHPLTQIAVASMGKTTWKRDTLILLVFALTLHRIGRKQNKTKQWY